MKTLIASIVVVTLLLFVAMNTVMITEQSLKWVSLHPKDPQAPRVLFWAGWWVGITGDTENGEKLFLKLYEMYPQENALVAEGLYRVAEFREQSSSRVTCLEFCKIVMEKYPSEEKWRIQASKLHDQVIYNAR